LGKFADIDALDLSPTARKAAEHLRSRYPSVQITSGRRSREDQARAMARNVQFQRDFIAAGYRDSSVKRACQDWVEANPEAITEGDLAAGLLAILQAFDTPALAKLSKHFTGDAFDVKPPALNPDDVKAEMQKLPGLDRFMERRDGSVLRWHAQFGKK
jgi:hypothetical protein